MKKFETEIRASFVELRLITVSKGVFKSSTEATSVSDWEGLSQFDQIDALGQLFAEIDDNPSNCEKMEDGKGFLLSFDFVSRLTDAQARALNIPGIFHIRLN